MKEIVINFKGKIWSVIILSVMVMYCCWPMIDYYIEGNVLVKISSFVMLLIISIIISIYIIAILYRNCINRGGGIEERKERIEGLDLVRTIAVILVITVHYINGTSYYSSPAHGISYFMITILRWISQCCCPLFIILSGYFLRKRAIDKKHYSGLLHLLRNYIIISIFYLIYIGPSRVNIETVKGLCNFNYMWYINMYFGLFLIIPFLNTLWLALDLNKRIFLLKILILLGSFASVTNFWWTNYWNSLYPILYYYIGVWFKEMEFKIRKVPGILLLFLMILFEAIYTYYIRPGEAFDWIVNFGGYSSGYNALPTVIASCLIFLLLKDIRIKNNVIKTVLKYISCNSLEIYLSLCMFLGAMIYQPIWRLFGPKIGIVGVYFILVPVEVVVATFFGLILNKGLDKLQFILCMVVQRYRKLIK